MSQQAPPPPAEGSAAAGTDLRGVLSGRRGGGRSTTTTVILCLVLVAFGLLGGIFIGHHFGQPAAAAAGDRPGFGQGGGFPGGGFPGAGNGNGAGGGNGNGNVPTFPSNGRFQFGTITSIDGNTITMETQDRDRRSRSRSGPGRTSRSPKSGSIGDLSNGDTIVVVGSQSSDGSIAATADQRGRWVRRRRVPGSGVVAVAGRERRVGPRSAGATASRVRTIPGMDIPDRAIDRVEAENRLLHRVIETITSSVELDAVLAATVELVTEATGGDACFLHLWEPEQERLVLRAATPEFGDAVGQVSLALGEGVSGWVAATRDVVLIPEDKWADPRYKYFPDLHGEMFTSMLSVPVVSRGGS